MSRESYRKLPIIQGEQLVSGDPAVCITTILGSCVAACLVDTVARVGGMNHFLLGEPGAGAEISPDQEARYGIHSMELLINGLLKAGAERGRIRAHLYGGARMLRGVTDIGRSNAEFACRFLATEGIEVVHSDMGGERARRVEFLPYAGRSRCRSNGAPPPPPRRAARVVRPVAEFELFA